MPPRWLWIVLGGTAALIMGSQISKLPVLNDVCTDLDTPVQFPSGNIGDLPESFRPKIRDFYFAHGLKPLTVKGLDAETVYNTALQVAKRTPRWEVTLEAQPQLTFQGVATTRLMRFKDDFAIRVTMAADFAVQVDMRSRSRIGKGDMGTNGRRIGTFLDELGQELKKAYPEASLLQHPEASAVQQQKQESS